MVDPLANFPVSVPELTSRVPIKLNRGVLLQSIEVSLGCSMPKRDRPPVKDDLTMRYEEILRLREELERLLARSKQSRSRKKSHPRKTPNRSRD
jgi:hypothetical protein